MTILFEDRIQLFQERYEVSSCKEIVISTGAQRSGEICGFFLRLSTHTLLAALRQRRKIAAIVTERCLQRGRSVRPGLIGGVYLSV
jgi:hypothetical protein